MWEIHTEPIFGCLWIAGPYIKERGTESRGPTRALGDALGYDTGDEPTEVGAKRTKNGSRLGKHVDVGTGTSIFRWLI